MTTSQKNAVQSAKDYLETQAFSKKGLIEQLSSSAGDGFPKRDLIQQLSSSAGDGFTPAQARYAVDKVY